MSRIGRVLLCVLAVGWLTSANADAQYVCWNVIGHDDVYGPQPGATAATFPCDANYQFNPNSTAGQGVAELWAYQMPHSAFYCSPLNAWNGQACQKIRSGGATVSAYMNHWWGVVGWRSRHWWIEPDGYWVYYGDEATLSIGYQPPSTKEPDEACPSGYYWDQNFEEYLCSTPILMPTGKRGVREDLYRLTSPENGVRFDINADGVLDQVAWTDAKADVAFLVLDRNQNGVIDNGRELFGDRTMPSAQNGFDALIQLAGGLNALKEPDLNAGAPLFHRLQLWTDRNHNGISEPDELEPFSKYYVSINLGYTEDNTVDRYGNAFKFKGYALARTALGANKPATRQEEQDRLVEVFDVYLRHR